jgi:hypothetical protein
MASATADEAKQSRFLVWLTALLALAERSAPGAEDDAALTSLGRSRWHITVSPVL